MIRPRVKKREIEFTVGVIENFLDAISHLKSKKVDLLAPPTHYPDRGFLSTCFRDPDGNLIEIEQMTDVLIS